MQPFLALRGDFLIRPPRAKNSAVSCSIVALASAFEMLARGGAPRNSAGMSPPDTLSVTFPAVRYRGRSQFTFRPIACSQFMRHVKQRGTVYACGQFVVARLRARGYLKIRANYVFVRLMKRCESVLSG